MAELEYLRMENAVLKELKAMREEQERTLPLTSTLAQPSVVQRPSCSPACPFLSRAQRGDSRTALCARDKGAQGHAGGTGANTDEKVLIVAKLKRRFPLGETGLPL